jgi:CheY-like chemotaxis protein
MNKHPSSISRKKRHIIVVGNKSQDILSLCTHLHLFGYEASSASTAAGALELVSKSIPALIITDVVLPGMSGIDLLELLKHETRTASIPIVFMIFPTDAAAERRCQGIGASGCISKPFQAEELYRIIQNVIEPRPRANIRIRTQLSVSLNQIPLECPEGGCKIELSEHGMYVPMVDPYPAHRRISLQINIKDRTISAEGSVLYRKTGSTGLSRGAGMGLLFTRIDPQDREYIRTYIRGEVARGINRTLVGEPAKRE